MYRVRWNDDRLRICLAGYPKKVLHEAASDEGCGNLLEQPFHAPNLPQGRLLYDPPEGNECISALSRNHLHALPSLYDAVSRDTAPAAPAHRGAAVAE